MYAIFAKEIADVDKSLFRQAGRFAHNVRAIPITDQVFATKSIRSNEFDSDIECQSSFFVTMDRDSGQYPMDQWMKPGILYQYDDQYFAELRYDYPLGILNIVVYFLVSVDECEFGYIKNDKHTTVTFDELKSLGDLLWE